MRTLPTPKAGLLNHNLDSQTLVYDPEADKVHLLDQTSSLVLDFINAAGVPTFIRPLPLSDVEEGQ